MTEGYPPHRHGSDRASSHDPFPRDRQQISRARQAAEALFKPKQQDTWPSGPDPHPSVTSSERKPRVLTSSPSAPARPAKDEAPADPEPPMPPAVPALHFARIRAWVKYGMTAPQVAQIYGVAVDEIERILRKA